MSTGGFDPTETRQFAAPDFNQPQGSGFGPTPDAPLPGELAPRLGARIIDGLIVGIPTGIVTFFLSYSLGLIGGVIGALLTAAATIGYFVFLETTRGQTLGKKIVGLRVVGPDGGLPTPKQSLIRNAFYGITVLGSIPFLGLLFNLAGLAFIILIAVTISKNPLRQGKHDELAGGTRVVQL
ncbi:RDD family protein [Rhodococcus sp. NPDC058521]|uniref:RDD family protein n=1 Tax=Rhodococcus sp. NPDC058521 TaxID=3346536 RepID=UPI003649CF6E